MTTVNSERETTSAVEAQESVAEDVAQPERAGRRFNWQRILVYGVLPGLALVLAMAAGFLKWQYSAGGGDDAARVESVQAAKDATIALLSYQPNTVDQQLGAASNLTTGSFRDSYTQLTTQVVIPGAKQKQISAVATVPAAASVSASENHAVVLVFVNQTTAIGRDAPSQSISSIRVAMDKVNGRWLISQFDPM